MNRKWRLRMVRAMLLVVLAVAGLAGGALWLGNRDVAPATRAEREQAYGRAVTWLRQHEAEILKEPNIALWWFVHAAATETADPYLVALMERYRAMAAREGVSRLLWWRMIDAQASVSPDSVQVQALAPYQRFFLHALTCQPVELSTGDTRAFLDERACRPALTQNDPACTTHQLIGVMLMAREACAPAAQLSPLQVNLLGDIEQQMQWDIVVKDAYLQRMVMLMWQGKPEQIKAVWLRRVLMAQQPDGGWIGGRQLPELPRRLQPWQIRSQLAAWWPSRFQAHTGSDFHATAQGLFITAMALSEHR